MLGNRNRRPQTWHVCAAAGSTLVLLAWTLGKSPAGSLVDGRQQVLDLWAGLPSFNDEQYGYCTPGQLANGTWHRMEEPFTSLKAMKEAYDMPESIHGTVTTCQATQLINDDTVRTLDVASWDWVPNNGCRTHRWTPMSFAIRFLRAPNGFISVGDSLSHQAFDFLSAYFTYPDSPFEYRHRDSVWGSISLRKNHPLTPSILLAAGVDPSRLESPFAIWYRHHHLVSLQEAGILFADEKEHEMWISREVDWWPLFENERDLNQLKQRRAAQAQAGAEDLLDLEERKRERDVFLVQVGAHWTKRELGTEMSDEGLVKGYSNMVDFLTNRLENMNPPANVLWRAVSPGHPDCNQYGTAEPERTIMNSTERPLQTAHNWVLFPQFNRAVADRLGYDSAQPQRRPPKLDAKTSMRFIDIWPMAIQRPEAHPGGNDCLHYCSVGVYSGWHDQYWHTIVQDSLYADYADYAHKPGSVYP